MSSYSELIKNFEKIRAYMREFYVYGFKSRDEYDGKSARSYDDERRRIESWLGDHTGFVRTPEGKNVFISIDSRLSCHNPFYKAWKAKSFTDGDITLHFILFDILFAEGDAYTLSEIMERIDGYLSEFSEPMVFDESTIRKKLKEYCSEGLVTAEKDGRKMLYRRADSSNIQLPDGFLDFFSEVAPVGSVGSFLLDRPEYDSTDRFTFKHHYITGAIDDDVLAEIFSAMQEHRFITYVSEGKSGLRNDLVQVVPLRVYISAQSGRRYLIAYRTNSDTVESIRIDRMSSVKAGEVCPEFCELRDRLDEMERYIWGVYISRNAFKKNLTETVEFTVKVGKDEDYIVNRLYRERRVGTVEELGDGLYRFFAEVYDTREMLTWIRTFICRIVDIKFSNKNVAKVFFGDMTKMLEIYGISLGKSDGKVDGDDIQ